MNRVVESLPASYRVMYHSQRLIPVVLRLEPRNLQISVQSDAEGGRIMNRHLLVVVLIMTLALVACGGGASGEGSEAVPAETIVVTPTPMGTLTVPPGATIELTINGPVPLEVTINAGEPVLFVLKDDEYGQSTVQFDDRKVGTMLWLLPGQSRIFARLSDKDPGTYTYKMLTRPDNKGTIIVK